MNRLTAPIRQLRPAQVFTLAWRACFAIAVGLFVVSSHASDTKSSNAIRDIVTARTEARVGSCAQANKTIDDIIDGLVKAFHADRHDPRVATALAGFPLRNCTPAGIKAFYANPPTAKPCPNGGDNTGYCLPPTTTTTTPGGTP